MTLKVGHGDTGDLTAGHSAPVTCVANLNKSVAKIVSERVSEYVSECVYA